MLWFHPLAPAIGHSSAIGSSGWNHSEWQGIQASDRKFQRELPLKAHNPPISVVSGAIWWTSLMLITCNGQTNRLHSICRWNAAYASALTDTGAVENVYWIKATTVHNYLEVCLPNRVHSWIPTMWRWQVSAGLTASVKRAECGLAVQCPSGKMFIGVTTLRFPSLSGKGPVPTLPTQESAPSLRARALSRFCLT